jgi:uncharacterized protein YbcC (UPF0753/DUF2309 family)
LRLLGIDRLGAETYRVRVVHAGRIASKLARVSDCVLAVSRPECLKRERIRALAKAVRELSWDCEYANRIGDKWNRTRPEWDLTGREHKIIAEALNAHPAA